MKLSLIAVASILSLVSACAPAPKAPAPKPAPVVEPVEGLTSFEAPAWQMSLNHDTLTWKRVDAPADPGDVVRSEFLAYTAERPEGIPVVTQVLSMPSERSEIDFIKGVLSDQSDRHDIKMIRVMKVRTHSGELGALVMQARVMSTGQILMFELITAKGNRGYVVTCAGALAGMKHFAEPCLSSMETFTLK